MGSYNFYSQALIAACNKILGKPHATAGRRDHAEFGTRWRVSSEYCAWIYYTPDDEYVLSRLTDQTMEDPAMRSKRCFLPSHVEDRRYPPDSIKYIYALHNHPYDSRISDDDIAFIIAEGRRHAFEVETKDGTLRLSIIAFFSNNPENPTCDGFYQYVPVTGQILKWNNTNRRWDCEQTHFITWWDDQVSFSVKETSAPCFKEGLP